MRYLPATLIKELPPLDVGTGASIYLLLFFEIAMEALDSGKDLPLDEATILWKLYTLFRTVTDLERKRPLITGLLINLPHNIQVDILREAQQLNDAGSAMIVSVLEEQNQLVEVLRPRSHGFVSDPPKSRPV